MLSKATSAAGGYLVPTSLDDQITAARRARAVIGAISRELITGDGTTLLVPSTTTHGVATWTAENASYTASDEVFGQVSVGAFVKGDDDRVFCHPKRGSMIDDVWWAAQFRKALAAAEIEGHVRPWHDLRHTAITNDAAAGSSGLAVMAKAGHRSMSTTKTYLHLAGVVFRDEADALERRLLTSAY